MTIIDNPKHAKFAQGLAQGKTQENAYIDAGYSENGARASASRLLTNANISARVRELQAEAEAKTGHSLVKMIEELQEFEKKARHSGQYNAAVKAIMLKARILGYL